MVFTTKLASVPSFGTPSSTQLPPQSSVSIDVRMRAGWPTHSNAKSTPFGQISLTASTVSTSGPAAMKWVAPNWRAAASFAGLVSTAMIGSASDEGQALDDVEADAADADHHGGLAVGRLGPVEHRADAGEDPAADEAGRRERHVAGRSRRPGVSFTTVCSENTPALANWNALLAADGERRLHLAEGLAAVRGLAAVAGRARAAVAERGEHDVVAHLHLRDGVADLLDDAGALVAEHDRASGTGWCRRSRSRRCGTGRRRGCAPAPRRGAASRTSTSSRTSSAPVQTIPFTVIPSVVRSDDVDHPGQTIDCISL